MIQAVNFWNEGVTPPSPPPRSPLHSADDQIHAKQIHNSFKKDMLAAAGLDAFKRSLLDLNK